MRCVLNGNGFLEDEILTTESILKIRNGSLVTGRLVMHIVINHDRLDTLMGISYFLLIPLVTVCSLVLNLRNNH